MTSRQMMAFDFSLSRALRFLTATLDGVIIIGLLVRLSYLIGWPQMDGRVYAGASHMLVPCWFIFVALHMALLFTARRRALFGLGRAFVYLVIAVAITGNVT